MQGKAEGVGGCAGGCREGDAGAWGELRVPGKVAGVGDSARRHRGRDGKAREWRETQRRSEEKAEASGQRQETQ